MNFSYINIIITKKIPQILYRIFLVLGIIFIVLLLVFHLMPEIVKSNTTIKGRIFTDQIWEKEILVTGDVTIMPFASVNVMPGTKVLFTANSDLCGGGEGDILDEMTKDDPTATAEYAKTHTSIAVLGNLTALGTKDKTIIFTSDAKEPTETDWNGIIFYGKSASGVLDNCEVSYCHYGPAVHFTDNVYIYSSLIKNCFWSGINSFMSSPVFINNEIIGCGHEGFDLHESNALIKGNVIRDSLVGMVINNNKDGQSVLVEDNKIINCANFLCLQDNVKATIKNNVFIGDIEKLPKKFTYKDFTIPYDVTPMGIEICDNADVVIEGNFFKGAVGYTILYSVTGPNEGINRSGFEGIPFEINGVPDRIVIKNNRFVDTAKIDIQKNLKNTVIENNIFE